jgi:hypothetical protein
LIAGLPWATWVLLAVAVLPGLGIVVAFYLANRGSSD